MTAAQRAFWRACAQGIFGDPGRDLITSWLASYVRGLDAGGASAQITLLHAACDSALGRPEMRSTLAQEVRSFRQRAALTSPLTAGQVLSALRLLVHEAVTTRTAAAGAGPAAPAGPGHVGDSVPAAAAAGLAAVVIAVAEEGSAEGKPLRERARELQETIDDREAAVSPSWDDPEDELVALLRADALGGDLQLREAAVRSCAGWLTQLAAQLADDACALPPEQVTATIRSRTIQLRASGQPPALTAAYAELERAYQPDNHPGKRLRKKDLSEAIATEKERLAAEVAKAAVILSERMPQLRAAAQQAAAGRDAITVDLAAAD